MAALTDFWLRYGVTDQGTARQVNKNAYRQPQIGMIDAVVSPENKGTFEQDFTKLVGGSGAEGKKKIAMITYNQRTLQSDTLDENDPELNYCETSRENKVVQMEQQVTHFVARQFKIGQEYLKTYGEDLNREFEKQLMMEAASAVTEMNQRIIALYEAVRGDTSAGNTTPLTSQGFSNAAQYITNIAFQEDVRKEFRKIQSGGRLIMVGDGLVDSYANVLKVGQVNNAGQRVDSSAFDRNFAFYPDATLDITIDPTLVENNNALIWENGAFQLLQWYQNRGAFRIVQEQVVNDTIAINVNGFRHVFDIFIRHTNCTDSGTAMHVTIKKWYDIWNFPTDTFKAADPLNGVNLLERWRMTTA